MAREEKETKDSGENIIDWTLRKAGIAALTCSYYHHYNFPMTGTFFVVTLTIVEALLLYTSREETSLIDQVIFFQ